MRNIASFLGFCLLLFLGSTSQAGVVIDDFGGPDVLVLANSSSAPKITAGVTRLVSTDQGIAELDGATNHLRYSGFASNSMLSLEYIFASPLNFTLPETSILAFDIFGSVQGSYSLNVGLSSFGMGTHNYLRSIAGPDLDIPMQFIDVGATAPLGIATSVDSVSFTITQTTPNFFAVMHQTPNAFIAAVPEPSSIALMGLVGLVRMFARRRPDKTIEN